MLLEGFLHIILCQVVPARILCHLTLLLGCEKSCGHPPPCTSQPVTDGREQKIGGRNSAQIVFETGGRTWPWTSSARRSNGGSSRPMTAQTRTWTSSGIAGDPAVCAKRCKLGGDVPCTKSCRLVCRRKNTRTNRRRKGRSTSFMSAWNVAGALLSLNGITKNSKSP
jgi:hypothetical protein